MSRLLVKERDERALRRLQASLLSISKKSLAKSIVLSKKDADSLAILLSTILEQKPILVDSYLTPNEAAKLAGVSRPLLIEMLKRGSLVGHTVGKHWRIKKESLINYITNRDQAARTTQELDEEDLACDK